VYPVMFCSPCDGRISVIDGLSLVLSVTDCYFRSLNVELVV
jgi:hypothetical protein